ncbi:hypothetical protein Poli38472_002417 [Pythium oligandrum]|uniref:Uncharacterized protein n=1 Tax=Pythium oligandrum TaxID=41045 RepID=A0A8K1CIN8_PYTOL|nr:hypothetical protein Poli38472_002417 [Pythium oligandrum]|eukprot:TMW63476.1 hypothetical protein Poli38472_002417 [Pythium oligandrum]
MRGHMRDGLVRVAACSALYAIYYDPQWLLSPLLRGSRPDAADPSMTAQEINEWRLRLTFAMTILSLLSVLTTPLVIVSCVHAGLHLVQFLAQTPLREPTTTWCWTDNRVDTCAYEYGSLCTFLLLLCCVFFPPPTSLSRLRQHRHQLRQFFKQHDPQYVSMVDRLLDEYMGNEPLLFARLRNIYRRRVASPKATTRHGKSKPTECI